MYTIILLFLLVYIQRVRLCTVVYVYGGHDNDGYGGVDNVQS